MMLRCPKCQQPLLKENNRYLCANGHSYDIAREGYVNLLLVNQKHSRNPGDNDDSLRARKAFLEKGYYQPLAEDLAVIVNKLFADGSSFLDAGCGTGYYLEHLINNVDKDIQYYAVDIAKKGVAMTAKKNKKAVCFVGSVFHLPFSDESLDGLMSVFTPYSGEEFNRIIKKGGYVIAVTPGRDHLYRLKDIVYDEVYLNEEAGYDLPGFELVEKHNVTYQKTLENARDIETLWRMTPYYHTTYSGNNDRLKAYDSIDTVIDFLVSAYRKEN